VIKELMESLACPTYKEDLELKIWDERGSEIWTDSIACAACHKSYPISESIPTRCPGTELEIPWTGICGRRGRPSPQQFRLPVLYTLLNANSQ